MDAERSLVSWIAMHGKGLDVLEGAGPEHFHTDECRDVWEFIVKHTEQYGKQPSIPLITAAYPDFNFEPSEETLEYIKDKFIVDFEKAMLDDFSYELARAIRGSERNGHSQLTELLVAKHEEINTLLAPLRNGSAAGFVATHSSDIEAEVPEYLDEGQRFPKGNVSLIVGEPGEGKGLLGCYLAAAIENGEQGFEQGSVAFIGHEDAQGVVAGRLKAATGAALLLEKKGQDKFFSFPSDIRVLRQAILEHELTAVVIDPFENHLDDGLNPNSNRELRRALTPLVGLAQETRCAIIIVHHTNKGSGTSAASRILGSDAGYRGGVRSVLVFGSDKEADPPEPDVRYLIQAKSNYGKKALPLKFTIDTKLVDVKLDAEPLPFLRLVGEVEDVDEESIFGKAQGRGRPKDEALREFIDSLILRKGNVIPMEFLVAEMDKANIESSKWRTVKDVLKKEHGFEHHKAKGLGHNKNYLRRPGASVNGCKCDDCASGESR